MPEFCCDLSGATTPLPHFWEECVGSGHSTLALRADYREHLKRCHEELGFKRLRFHGWYLDEMSVVTTHEKKVCYSFFNPDSIIDFLASIGMSPFVELSFMPTPLASGHQTVFRYRGNVTPPSDYRQWTELIRATVAHWRERYGARPLRDWLFEVWNEPNLKSFWQGTQADYFKLYRLTVEPIKKLDASLRVGGPATAQNAWIEEFLDFCERNKLPADFVSTHHYPNDPPVDEVSDKTYVQLSNAWRGRSRWEAEDAHRRARGRPFYYTEWNSSSDSRDPLHDEPYAAAFIVKTILEANRLVDGYSFWVFSDIFDENEFVSTPFHGGFGLMNVYGIPKPSYRAFELLHQLGTELLLVDGLHPTINSWVVRGQDEVTVLLTNHALPGHQIEEETVHVNLQRSPKPRVVTVQRIDATHANARRVWLQMGETESLDSSQIDRLETASRSRDEKLSFEYKKTNVRFKIALLPHAVAAIKLEFARMKPRR
jgi:xylan 1,4-beta-xylosidase